MLIWCSDGNYHDVPDDTNPYYYAERINSTQDIEETYYRNLEREAGQMKTRIAELERQYALLIRENGDKGIREQEIAKLIKEYVIKELKKIKTKNITWH